MIGGVNINTDDDNITSGAMYAVADDLPFLDKPETASDFFRLGFGSYRAGAATVFKQWEYGGIGVDVITGKASLNIKDIGLGINILNLIGNIRIPLPSDEYVVIEGEIGVGLKFETGAVRAEVGAEITGGFAIYVDDYKTN